MNGYTIFIQPGDGSQHRVDVPFAGEADKLAAWVHKATGAAVQIYDVRRLSVRKTFGDFDIGMV